MEVLCGVVGQGSFSGAADALGYTQPAVSRQIATLWVGEGGEVGGRVAQGGGVEDGGRLVGEGGGDDRRAGRCCGGGGVVAGGAGWRRGAAGGFGGGLAGCGGWPWGGPAGAPRRWGSGGDWGGGGRDRGCGWVRVRSRWRWCMPGAWRRGEVGVWRSVGCLKVRCAARCPFRCCRGCGVGGLGGCGRGVRDVWMMCDLMACVARLALGLRRWWSAEDLRGVWGGVGRSGAGVRRGGGRAEDWGGCAGEEGCGS